jgi:hypothetical protein
MNTVKNTPTSTTSLPSVGLPTSILRGGPFRLTTLYRNVSLGSGANGILSHLSNEDPEVFH